jgi:hypothetical protein
MQTCIGEHGGAFREFVNGSGSEFVGVGHGASSVIGGEQIAAR